ncbi:penicillin-binding transpeptidase domain-containing protein [Rarobacter faecitabidus]|uniref:Cell elongation-specific peptidoglycan D,D-transpeptidase n=1 Tax=Rarobacter faecitabidus TaxID=13243 RepID=A0A542ZPN9_RARFA|nr:penicillin-binding protein 2 [Rarobacter faecitabidus]TQL62180.1 cell elongation-specific peptidoglycan D,D-transpeptidase [Rarobacter faecitabidus]
MNAPIRKLAVASLVLFMALLLAVTYIQVVQAPTLNADPRNRRTLYQEFNSHRGPIIVDGTNVAYSQEVDDDYGYQRFYSDGALYAPVTGFYSVVVGRAGLERYSNNLLNGSSDSLWFNRLQTVLMGKTPQGSSVETTLDASVQEAAAKALGENRGAAVAIDIATGNILAMVTSPSYDPNDLATHDRAAAANRYQELLDADGDPLINRAIAGDTYPPGSVFKLITAATALETGQQGLDELDGTDAYRLPQSSSTVGNFGGGACSPSGSISLLDALRISCNTAFASLGNQLGDAALRAQADRFGFDTALSIPMPVTESRFPDDLDAPQTALAAIGQGSVRVTPLQVAMISAAIGGGGMLLQPQLVKQVRTADLTVVERAERHELGQAVSAETAQELTDMMIEVVKSGTGTRAQLSGVTVAGKTGTAESGTGKAPHAWFTGFAPAENPRIAVAVVVENGGSAGSEATGGTVAAPIAAAILKAGLK